MSVEGVARFAGAGRAGSGVELTLRTVSAVVLAAFGLGARLSRRRRRRHRRRGWFRRSSISNGSELTEGSATRRLPFTAAIARGDR